MWADGLHHPCYLRSPQPFNARDKIRSGPTCGQIGYITLFGGTTTLQSGGRNQKWQTCGRVGCITTAVSGVPKASERGETYRKWAHMWADGLHHPCCLRSPQHFSARDIIISGPTCGRIGYITAAVRVLPNASEWGMNSEVVPHLGGLATSPLPSLGSPTHHSGERNQKWAQMWADWVHHHCCLRASATLQSRGQNQGAHMWADWLQHSCRLGGPQRFRTGDKVGSVLTSGQICYITPTVWGLPNVSERGTKSEVGPHVGALAISALPFGGSTRLQYGG